MLPTSKVPAENRTELSVMSKEVWSPRHLSPECSCNLDARRLTDPTTRRWTVTAHPHFTGGTQVSKRRGVSSAQGQCHQRGPMSCCKHSWPYVRPPPPAPITKATAKSLPSPRKHEEDVPKPWGCWREGAAADAVPNHSAGLLPGQGARRVNLLLKRAGRRLSGFSGLRGAAV